MDPRFDVPNFPDPPVLAAMVERTRAKRFNGLVILGACMIAFAAFVGWTFSLSKILEMQARCRSEAEGMKNARALCEKWRDRFKSSSSTSDDRCPKVPTDRGAYEWCIDPEGTGLSGEVEQFGLGAIAIGGVGILLLSIGIVRRLFGVPSIVKVLRDPQRIVWIYEDSTRFNRGPAIQGVTLGLDSGTTEGVVVAEGVGAHDVVYGRRVVAAVAKIAPWATVGWTEDREKVFQRDPRALRAG